MAIPPNEAVSDTGPLISFEKLPNGVSILKALFSRLFIPPEVLQELQAGSAGKDYLRNQGLADFVQVVSGDGSWDEPEAQELDLGEKAAIDLAVTKGCPLLIEERLGRRLAQGAGVPVIGAAGLVRVAYERGVLSLNEAAEALQQLRAAGRIGKQLLQRMLADLGTV
jgi:predicted nucleic acid-binding protein